MKGMKMEKEQLAELHKNLVHEFKSYLSREENKNIEALILGVSGGIDSALVAALACEAIEDFNIVLYGYSLPIATNKEDETARASAVGNDFCDAFTMRKLDEEYTNLTARLIGNEYFDPDNIDVRIRAGNLKARLRMIYLYDQARKHKGMVLSTDNYTELMLGFWTLHGDVGDFGCIQNLWKTEVYELAQYLVEHYYGCCQMSTTLLECIYAVPTDGLGVTDSDMDQLLPDWSKYVNPKLDHPVGWQAYELIDSIIKEWVLFKRNEQHPVIERVKATGFKRENPYNIPREKLITYSMYPSNN